MAMENPKHDTIEACENEDEDYGCFFLQPSSSPYDIAEKVQQANYDLFNSNLSREKTAKVKFKEDLVSYEPDLTDDDVNSITSDVSDENSEAESCNYKTTLNRIGVYENHEELEDDEVVEEIEDDVDNSSGVENVKTSSKDAESAIIEEHQTISVRNSSRKIKRKKSCTSKHLLSEVHCKDHCIEKIDYNLSMSIKRLEICEKPVNLPPLHLRARECCEELKHLNSSRNLPNYNGVRSEYGLTQRQLQMKQKQLEQLKKKEIARQKLIEEFRFRKIQQNEQIFCQWLKEVSKRNKSSSSNKNTIQKHKEGLSPNVINLSNSSISERNKIKERPKTANEFIPKTNIKKKRRPHTTQSCVYIEVPQKVLEKGIHIGDLLITNSKMFTKKLHILTVS